MLAYAAARRVCGPPTLRGGRGFAALGLLGWGLVLHPLAAPLFGRPLAQAEVAGIAPDPTAIATLGVGLLLPSGPMRLTVLAIAALWVGASALTLWLLGAPERVVPVLALLVAAAGLAARSGDG